MWQRVKMMASASSQLGNVLTARDLTATGPNESISARMHRQGHKRREAIINWLLRDDNHCRNAFLSDVRDARALIAEYEGRTR